MHVTAGPHRTVEGVLAWMAIELGSVADSLVPAMIGGLAAQLVAPAGDPEGELAELGDRIGRALHVRRPSMGHNPGFDDLRPDLVLARLAGDELVLAAILTAAGQRAGFDVAVVLGPRRALVAHRRLDVSLALCPRQESRIIDARRLCGDLEWADPPDVAAALLDRLDERAALVGDLAMRIQVHELKLSLPSDRHERGRRTVALARTRAGLN